MACPHIYYDTSGLADEELITVTGQQRIQAVLLKTLQENPKKIIFWTDYAMCNRRDHFDLIRQLHVTAEVWEGILGRNALELFKLPVQNG